MIMKINILCKTNIYNIMLNDLVPNQVTYLSEGAAKQRTQSGKQDVAKMVIIKYYHEYYI